MTTTTESPTTISTTRDWRPGQRARGTVLAVGGALYSLSHVLNLFGSTPDVSSPLEIAAKYLFGAGAILIMAGLGSLMSQFRMSPLGVLGVQLTWAGLLFIPLSAYSVLYILPLYGWEGLSAIDANASVLGLLTLPTVLGGPVLLAIASIRNRVALPLPVAIAFLACVAGYVVMFAVPEIEPPIAIATTIVFGAGYAWAGLAARTAEVR